MSLETTSSQTIGPYLHIGLTWLITDDLVGRGTSGEQVTVEGRVVDGDGNAVNDAVIEIWQANAHGRYAHPDDVQDKPLEAGFKGFGRVATDREGRFRFTTVKPGRVPAPDGGSQAPHLNVTLFTRGLLKHLITRMYFPGDAANADDPVLQGVPGERRATLIATQAAGKRGVLEWNIVLQGNDETVFFEY
jgi:protocatechuate 3,4-dioxygenase, alpha subunit